MVKERKQRAAFLKTPKEECREAPYVKSLVIKYALDWVIGFGHRPFRAFIWLFALWLGATVAFHQTWEAWDFAPNAAPVLVSAEWKAAVGAEQRARDRGETPTPAAHVWSGEGLTAEELDAANQPGRDYETFNRFAYAFDVVVPLIDLGQEAAWTPSTTRGAWGWHAWWLRWVLKIAGWFVSALGAAAITGVIRRD